MDAKVLNRLQVLAAFCGAGLGLITIYVPTWLFIPASPEFDYDTLVKAHPHKRVAVIVYEVCAFLNILAAMVYSIFLVAGIQPWMKPAMFFCIIFNSIGILNGVFEILTGICPKRGINVRLSHLQRYVVHPHVRRTGVLRVMLGLLLIIIPWMVFRVPTG